jgi:hypothetical protein
MIKEFTGVAKGVLELDTPLKGILVKGLKKTSTIKIDAKNENSGDFNVIPELKASVIRDIVNTISPRPFISVEDKAGVIEMLYIPFAVSGAVDLDEKGKTYEVIFGNISGQTVQVFGIEAHDLTQDIDVTPISIQRADIKASLTEKEIEVTGVSALLFDTDEPTKIEYRNRTNGGKLRKVVQTNEQMKFGQLQNRITTLKDGAFVTENENLIVPVRHIPYSALLHKDTTKEMIYYKIFL